METYEGNNLQSTNIYFEDTNIAVLKTLPDVWAWETIVVGYDREGNAHMLDR